MRSEITVGDVIWPKTLKTIGRADGLGMPSAPCDGVFALLWTFGSEDPNLSLSRLHTYIFGSNGALVKAEESRAR